MFHRLSHIFKLPEENDFGGEIRIVMLIMLCMVVLMNLWFCYKNGGLRKKKKTKQSTKESKDGKDNKNESAGSNSSKANGGASVKVGKTNSERHRGLFSTTSASVGSTLVVESPLFIAPSRPRSLLQPAFDKLDADTQDLVWTFEDSYAKEGGGKTLYGIMRTNCHGLGNQLDDDGKEDRDAAGNLNVPLCTKREQAGLFTMVSRVNHSCLPNATLIAATGGSETNQLALIALKKIEKDEEITISYLDDIEGKDYSQRKAELSSRFQFECCCALCLAHGALNASNGSERNEDRIRSDSNRRRIQTLRSLLGSLGSDPARAEQTMQRISELMHAEGFDFHDNLASSLELTASILSKHLDSSTFAIRAEESAEKAAEIRMKVFGPTSSKAKQALKLVDEIRAAIKTGSSKKDE